MKFKREFITIFIIMVTEVLGFSLILPLLPFYAQDLGASPFTVGLILATFSFFQFISAPIMGRLSDFYGRKPLLILSQLSTFASFIILGLANTLWLIFASRIVDGLLGSNFTIAQAYLSDISSKKDRSKVFGISGAAFGFGFLVGPGVGGLLSQISFALPAFLAAGLSLVTILTTFFFLPETVKKKKALPLDIKIFTPSDFKKYFSDSRLSSNLQCFFAFVLTHSLWVSSFALFTERQLGFGPAQTGYFLTFIGLINITLRGILLGKIIDLFSEKRLKVIGVFSVVVALTFASFITQKWLLLAAMALFAFGNAVSRPLLIGSISRNVSARQQGAILGFTGSLGSLSQIIGPLVGGFLINNFFPGSLGLASASVMILGIWSIFRKKKFSLAEIC